MTSFVRLNEIDSHLKTVQTPYPAPPSPMRLTGLPTGAHATVARVSGSSSAVGPAMLDRLGELGFIPGEPVHLLQRGPGGLEPLAVVVGETMFALRWIEADCIEVSLP